MMLGSDQLNVMPRRPHIDVDCRLLPGTSPADVTKMLEDIIGDKEVQIEAKCEVQSLSERGLPISPSNGPQWNFLQNSIR
jgi:acetylornithine deacetylase/succinyl-diaminopimelate desuccinylase-like protein